jgi:hypothetical protein
MGGGNESANLVNLTPEEHFVAHQLLVKMYPEIGALATAAYMMTVASTQQVRSNKLYGWLRRKHAANISSIQTKRNSQAGTCWIHKMDQVTKIPLTSLDEYTANGWKRGRTSNANCEVCGVDSGSKERRFCKDHRPFNRSEPKISDRIFLETLLFNNRNILRTIKQLNMGGMGTNYSRAKRLLSLHDRP